MYLDLFILYMFVRGSDLPHLIGFPALPDPFSMKKCVTYLVLVLRLPQGLHLSPRPQGHEQLNVVAAFGPLLRTCIMHVREGDKVFLESKYKYACFKKKTLDTFFTHVGVST